VAPARQGQRITRLQYGCIAAIITGMMLVSA